MSRRSVRRLVTAFALLALAAAPGAPLAAAVRIEGDLPRRADPGFALRSLDGALVVRRVVEGSAAALAGLREGDRLRAIGGRAVLSPPAGAELVRGLDGGRPARLTVEREGRTVDLAFTPSPLPMEDLDGLETVYGVVETPDGARLRAVVTRPAGASGPLPAIFFTQWVSCDGIEPIGNGNHLQLLRALAQRSGAVLLRVDRSAGGDSEGPGCHELDYETELAHYRHAFDVLTARPEVDRRRVVIFGNSLGSTTAPLLAATREVAGVAVSGGGALTYFERLLAFDRLGFELGGTPPAEIDARMRHHAEFLERYLHHDEDPAAIARQRPELAGVWSAMRGTGDGTHYGRPFAWHRQLARRDLLGAWSQITAPVIAVYGAFDQFEPPHAHRAAVAMLERLRPGQAQAIEIAQMNHFYDVHPTAVDAALGRHGQPAWELAAGALLGWLRDRLDISPAGGG
jgi:pimeloyl-ACP methyl ester carboxylesterase